MTVNQRVRDILIGAIFGLVLGIVCNLWSSVFELLFLENASRDFLYKLFFLYSGGIVLIGILLWKYMSRLE